METGDIETRIKNKLLSKKRLGGLMLAAIVLAVLVGGSWYAWNRHNRVDDVAAFITSNQTLMQQGKYDDVIGHMESLLGRSDLTKQQRLDALNLLIRCRSVAHKTDHLMEEAQQAANLSKELTGSTGTAGVLVKSLTEQEATQKAIDKANQALPTSQGGSDGKPL